MTGVAFAAHVAAFAVAALACFAGLSRVRYVEDPDTRRGLAGLLATSGGWAAAQAGFLALPTQPVKVGVYTVGLVAGFATVGAWLYFCSAYTGRTLHRNPAVRRAALAVFLVVVVAKLTNPVHGAYYDLVRVSAPFPHLAVRHGVVHWLAMGASYALAAVGGFMLFELLTQTGYDTRPLLALVGLTGLPVVADVVGTATPHLAALTYEPLGVAAFAVGVLFVYEERFQAVRLAADVDDAVVFLTDDDAVREANQRAVDLFPALADATGAPLADVAPGLAERLPGDAPVLELTVDGERRFFQVSATPFTFGRTRVGRMVVVADVTRAERNRRALERQNERLAEFASVVSHDLRNPLNVAAGRLDMERERRDSEDLDAVAGALDRMEALIDDLLLLAREGADIGDRERVTLAALAERAWASIAAPDATLVVDDDAAFEADADRVVQLLENVLRNAAEHGGADVTVRVGVLDDGRGFYVEDDGPGIPEADRESVFGMGVSTADGTGFGLAIVRTIAEAHGWSVAATDAAAADTGARFEVTGVDLADVELAA
ncbi:sensor histidine kinase [Halobacterium yunchengense]|uniref:sensor histidine kinase n=1 Tax=Halobacterium yunchengense TaxID=3108497 RepID=UPI003009E4A9